MLVLHRLPLQTALKRGALVAAANWPVALIQSAADGLFKLLIAVPLAGGAILVTLVIGADADAGAVDWQVLATSLASALTAHRPVLVAFVLSLGVIIVGGSLFVFLAKGGTVGVLVEAERQAAAVEEPPLRPDRLAGASAFSIERFTGSARALFPRYARLGFGLMAVYVCSGAAYVAVVVRPGGGEGWGLTTVATLGFVLWTTLVNLLYLLVQLVVAADDCGVLAAARRVLAFVGREHRRIGGVFLVILGMVLLATAASVAAFAALGLIVLVPFVWLAAIPLQLVAVLLRAVVLQYIGLTSIGAYVRLYREFRDQPGHRASRAAVTPVGGTMALPES